MANEPIPQGATLGEAIPSGATLGPAAAAPKTEPIPTGATLGAPVGGSTQTPPVHTPPHTGSILGDAALGALSGVGAGVFETAEGAKNLANKVLPASAQIPDIPPEYRENVSGAEKAGGAMEAIGEFVAGDEALAGLGRAAKIVDAAEKIPALAKTLAAAEKSKLLSGIISSTLGAGKAALVGGAQGAVKGAAEGKTKQEAEGGAIGGAVGGAAGEGIAAGAEAAAPLVKKIAGTLGIGNDGVTALTRALRPTGLAAQKFPEQAEAALPRLVEANKTTPITNLDELATTAHTLAQGVWANEIKPQIAKWANEGISGAPIAQAIRNGVLTGDKDLFEGAADASEALAKKFDGNMTMQQASDRMQSLNRKVASLYKMDPASRYAATANNPSMEAMEDAANELRHQIYTKLEELGEKDPAKLRETYGGLKAVEQAANKRAVVYGRQNNPNLTEILTAAAGAGEAATAVMSGHPLEALAGAVPFIVARVAKYLNAPETLIQDAVTKGLEDSGIAKTLTTTVPQAAAKGVAATARTAGPGAGAKAGEEVANRLTPNAPPKPTRVIFQASDGTMHSIPIEQLPAAQKIDPKLTIGQEF